MSTFTGLILPTEIPLYAVKSALLQKTGVELHVLRLDMIDPYAGGNKIFKLKYNLEAAKQGGFKRIVTFGGAWSNHLAAVAAVLSPKSGVQSLANDIIGIVRGEEPAVLSDTLRFCRERGMKLHFISRKEYKRKNEQGFIEELRKQFGDFYLLPEGGTNEFAVKGCREILNYVKTDFNYVCCPVGSGGTFAGLVSALKPSQKALGYVALKNGEYMAKEIARLASSQNDHTLIHDYHFGGFAKTTPKLVEFKKKFERENGFELDHVYTAKMFYGIYDMVRKHDFVAGSKIIALHTGGLQGNKGFTEL